MVIAIFMAWLTSEYKRWPDKAGPSRRHFGRAVDRSIRMLCESQFEENPNINTKTFLCMAYFSYLYQKLLLVAYIPYKSMVILNTIVSLNTNIMSIHILIYLCIFNMFDSGSTTILWAMRTWRWEWTVWPRGQQRRQQQEAGHVRATCKRMSIMGTAITK